ncbi:hypothetical protein AAEQ94_11540, partial [Pseudomonas aeruginosa]
GCIAVIATEATVRAGSYQRAILQIRPEARVQAEPAGLFVALAEEGPHQGSIAEEVAEHYLRPIFHPMVTSQQVPDTLVLGCTH